MSEDTAKDQVDTHAATGATHPVAALVTRITFVLGVVATFNIIGSAQGLITLSASMRLLVAIFRDIQDALYGWLPFHLPDLTRDALTILGLGLAAINGQLLTTRGISFFDMLGSFWGNAKGKAAMEDMMSDVPKHRFEYIFCALCVAAFMIFFCIAIPAVGVLLLLSFISIAAFLVPLIAKQGLIPQTTLYRLLMLTWMPGAMTLTIILAASFFKRALVWTAGWILLLLLLNELARTVEPRLGGYLNTLASMS
ncbi:hypothetical protein ASE17_17350 [Phenylobacterium sp. Root77]|uniref:hypothetical protein n=1 Tax=unclassified Phenylobacterium TaxID=2640670 RepID=UPI0006F2ECF9|nr:MULTISPECIES: hypothetical protein [unclassified Phenylobacterium]KQW70642.1 hypothetical protein ASC73_11220 [Phenylobacterium sp. Root1277]KQW90938.1 hypothetical protein ASC79_16370 [Phenylobacterium sp. Root1290]KRC39430.1 hypothetical protein ASE17_17350 [Phenylobacterium sp. Root77]